jgi:nanoRNase/pAp phosphatase (c-di-AMP/oligoRNAs hydrolase)
VQERLELLLDALGGAKQILILPHTDPDPDAIASAVALRHLLAARSGVEGHIGYRGLIGRSENKALVRYLGHPLRRLSSLDLRRRVPIALIDTQPGAGNNALPLARVAEIVIDHHPWRDETALAAFADVRPRAGATSTILTGYLRAADIEPPLALATALFYGIKTDTMGLGRGASSEDVAAYFYLQPRIDVEALTRIEYAQVPAIYFRRLVTALQTARIYDGAVISYVGPVDYPDLTAEIADLLLRLQGAHRVVCMGIYKGNLVLSVRTHDWRDGAHQLVQAIVDDRGTAGGHGTMAGGRVPLRGEDPEALSMQLTRRALDYLQITQEVAGKPLI